MPWVKYFILVVFGLLLVELVALVALSVAWAVKERGVKVLLEFLVIVVGVLGGVGLLTYYVPWLAVLLLTTAMLVLVTICIIEEIRRG